MDLVGLNEAGYPVGETHPNARLTDAQVDEIRNLHETGRWGYTALAERFGVSRSLIAAICRYEIRVQWPVRWKKRCEAARTT